MNVPKTCLFLVVCFLLVSESGASAGTQVSFYVSPAGNDNNAGTQNAPYKTITRARDIARTINGSMTGDIIVYFPATGFKPTVFRRFALSASGERVSWATIPLLG